MLIGIVLIAPIQLVTLRRWRFCLNRRLLIQKEVFPLLEYPRPRHADVLYILVTDLIQYYRCGDVSFFRLGFNHVSTSRAAIRRVYERGAREFAIAGEVCAGNLLGSGFQKPTFRHVYQNSGSYVV